MYLLVICEEIDQTSCNGLPVLAHRRTQWYIRRR